MKKYGVVINATVVAQKALDMGLAKTKDELTAGMRAQAAYQLIVESSTDAIGDMARTSDSFANTAKAASAAWEDFMAELGKELLPTATAILQWAVGYLKDVVFVIKEIQMLVDRLQAAQARATGKWRMGMPPGGDRRQEVTEPMPTAPGTEQAEAISKVTEAISQRTKAEAELVEMQSRQHIQAAALAEENLRAYIERSNAEIEAEKAMLEEKIALQEEYFTARTEREMAAYAESTRLWGEAHRAEVQTLKMREQANKQYAGAFLNILGFIRTKSLAVQLGILAAQTAIQYGQAVASAHAGAALALATIPPPAGEAVAAERLAYGLALAKGVLIAGAGKAIGMAISAATAPSTTTSGFSPAARATVEGPAIPTIEAERQRGLTIIIEGDVLADEYYLEYLASKISEAVEDRDVSLVASETRAF